jgi:hypothetical protein
MVQPPDRMHILKHTYLLFQLLNPSSQVFIAHD